MTDFRRALSYRRFSPVTKLWSAGRRSGWQFFYRSLPVAFATLVAWGAAVAQTQLGTVSGRVLDPGDAVIVGARVVLTNLGTLTKEISITNGEGAFAIGSITPGAYEIMVEKTGFQRVSQRFTVEVAQHVTLPIKLQLGSTTETVEVSAGAAVEVNTVSAEVSHEITSSEIANLPLLTRNPYALMELAPGSVNANVATGDYANALGIVIGGSRGRSITFLLDGAENNNSFATGPSTLVPVDAVQEFKVQSNNMTAEFGRNALLANVVSKSGSNNLHARFSEFYRGAALASRPVEEVANQIPKGNFVRNVFSGAVGGPIVRDKTFFYGALEGTRVRSVSRNFWFVPTQQFAANASANMNAYLQAAGGLPQPRLPEIITAADLVAVEQADGVPYGTDPKHSLFKSGTTNLIPGSTPLFQHTFTSVPSDAGASPAQNTWSVFGRGDHQFSDKTGLSLRYAWYRQLFFTGYGADSPFTAFQVPYSYRSQNASISMTHAFAANLFSESRFTFSRTQPELPLGKASPNVMCYTYANATAFQTGDPIVFGGYTPNSCFGNALPSGGPQNTLSGYIGFTFARGRNIWKWGGYLRHLRDNHTFGAFENAFALASGAQNLLDGVADGDFRVAINPRGKVPGQIYNPAVDGAIVPPSFTRHYRYNEFALYGEDSIKLRSNLTLTAGLRWEYFGVLHSPDKEKALDANLYLGTTGSIFQQISSARFRQTNQFFNQNFTNFGPRVALAWDLSGDARTVLRAGYGIFYDANFGNALFNAIQNPPNYAVVQQPGGLVFPNQYDTLRNVLGSGSFTYSSSARMLNKDMHTAYTQQWNATLEQNLFGKAVLVSAAYVAAKGDKLYSLNNLNQRNSCILLNNCRPGFDRLNQTGVTSMNRRANEGFSRYHSMQLQLRTREIPHTGLQLNTNYTWAHAIDNSTSFFNDSAFDFNGHFGFSNPYNPAADRADSSNDIRHRFAMNYSWNLPWAHQLTGLRGQLLDGWTLTGIYTAQTGGAFSVYENFAAFADPCSRSNANACYPVLVGALPQMNGHAWTAPNRVLLYHLAGSLTDLAHYCGGNAACTQRDYYFPPRGLFLPRNTFRTPGYWNFDAAVLKNFKLRGESTTLQFRAEFFNILNHSNLYADPNTNNLAGGAVLGRRGIPPSHELYFVPFDRRNIQLGARLEF